MRSIIECMSPNIGQIICELKMIYTTQSAVDMPAFPELNGLISWRLREFNIHTRRQGNKSLIGYSDLAELRRKVNLNEARILEVVPTGLSIIGWCPSAPDLLASYLRFAKEELADGAHENAGHIRGHLSSLEDIEEMLTYGCGRAQMIRQIDRFIARQSFREAWVDAKSDLSKILGDFSGEVWITGFHELRSDSALTPGIGNVLLAYRDERKARRQA